MNTLMVTAYTYGYLDLKNRLKHSAEKFGHCVYSEMYGSTGDWVRNGHIKPKRIMAELGRNYPHGPVCWVDADAEFVADPKDLDGLIGSCDVAVCRLAPKEVLSGTVWFAPTPGAMWLLAAWQDECRKSAVIWDQAALYQAMNRKGAPVKVGELDSRFCFIPGTSPPPRKGSVVITHHQASREVRAGTRQM